MNEIIIDKVAQYIEALASSLGFAAAHVYEVLTWQKLVGGIVSLSWIVVILVVGAYVLNKVYRAANRADDNGEDTTWYGGLILTIGIIYLIVVVVALFSVPTSIMKIANPEYYVIRELLGAVKGGVK